ncbi:MAG: N-acetylneuraminate synthase family protein, partial [Candidatus Margulisiibacteriota bacterium]
RSARYSETIIGTEETIYDMFERLEMTFEQQKEIFAYARKRKIEVFSTPFDIESVDFLESLGVNAYKIASMDIVNIPLIKRAARTKKPVIISTGMSNLGQVEEAVEAVLGEGNPNIVLLHCNSSYPSAPEEMNLEIINTLKQCFNVSVGLSDHTLGLFVSKIALCLGADIIERHFTLDRMMEGPDHILSSEPDEIADLVVMAKKTGQEFCSELLRSKEARAVIGSGVRRIQPNEYDTLNTQRKSLYAAKDIFKGEVITGEKVTIKGPGGGLLPRYLDIVIGRSARADIKEDLPITWDDI